MNQLIHHIALVFSTKIPVGGRGIDIALCKKVINLYDGKSWGKNNEEKGAIFKFVLVNKTSYS